MKERFAGLFAARTRTSGRGLRGPRRVRGAGAESARAAHHPYNTEREVFATETSSSPSGPAVSRTPGAISRPPRAAGSVPARARQLGIGDERQSACVKRRVRLSDDS